MNKVPFTPEGVREKQAEINRFSFEERLEISDRIANDSTNWILENFEMSDEQVDYLKNLEIMDSKLMGWSLAIGTLGQLPIEMQDTTPPKAALAEKKKKKKKLEVGMESTYDPSTQKTTPKGTVKMTWEW